MAETEEGRHRETGVENEEGQLKLELCAWSSTQERTLRRPGRQLEQPSNNRHSAQARSCFSKYGTHLPWRL